jgi:hypothetical protein
LLGLVLALREDILMDLVEIPIKKTWTLNAPFERVVTVFAESVGQGRLRPGKHYPAQEEFDFDGPNPNGLGRGQGRFTLISKGSQTEITLNATFAVPMPGLPPSALSEIRQGIALAIQNLIYKELQEAERAAQQAFGAGGLGAA